MIPGMSCAVETRLREFLVPAVTNMREETLVGMEVTLLAADDEGARALGIQFEGGPHMTVVVTDPSRPLGYVRLQSSGYHNMVFFDNRVWSGNFHANIRFSGNESALIFNSIESKYVAIHHVLLRSDQQFLFWGTGASAVGCHIEIEGVGRGVVIGDDALISNGVWIRNYDMHSMHHLCTGASIGRQPLDSVIERHVWLGQDALLLSCERVGMGSVIGARALAKGVVPACVIAAGMPARVIRKDVSWGRHPYSVTGCERISIGITELQERVDRT
jgi:carbonic anhydrase/acetyltransferase-like protein (isoleucine patch superfamily)